MDNLKELKELIHKVEVALDNKEGIKNIKLLLCQIGAELLTDYEIRIGNITIEPLRVEPYLFKAGSKYEDKFIHSESGIYGKHQTNRFGKLYIHNGYNGVDIVLSQNKEYAFSFLIKNSRIKSDGNIVYEIVKQQNAAKFLKSKAIPIDYDEVVLFRKEKTNSSPVFRTIRNGLASIAERDDFKKDEQKKYNQLMISSFIELKEHTSKDFGFEATYGGERAVVEYLKEYKKCHPNVTKEELNVMRKQLYPNGGKTLFEKEFGK